MGSIILIILIPPIILTVFAIIFVAPIKDLKP